MRSTSCVGLLSAAFSSPSFSWNRWAELESRSPDRVISATGPARTMVISKAIDRPLAESGLNEFVRAPPPDQDNHRAAPDQELPLVGQSGLGTDGPDVLGRSHAGVGKDVPARTIRERRQLACIVVAVHIH